MYPMVLNYSFYRLASYFDILKSEQYAVNLNQHGGWVKIMMLYASVLDKTYMPGIKGDTGTQVWKVKVNEQIHKYTDFYLW
jgi:hypothetical protein